MNPLIKELINQLKNTSLEEFDKDHEDYQKLVSEFHVRRQENEKRHAELNRKKRFEDLTQLYATTKYIDPVYPEMGVPGKNGSCEFKSEADAKKLLDLLIPQSYYYAHILKWNGPGKYQIIPSFDTDHDRETIYTATYVKKGK